MSDYTLAVSLDQAFGATVAAVRESLSRHGFGVLTEIDVAATLKAKLGVDIPPQVILGACRPELAHRALQAAPSVAALLPCNVAVRATDAGCIVEAIDPAAMMRLAGGAVPAEVVDDARERLVAALDELTDGSPGAGVRV